MSYLAYIGVFGIKKHQDSPPKKPVFNNKDQCF
jgi:hypothetical protein